jgi:hypothetical protein
MAKKQTRRSISVSRTTYERLKAFCETNNISMSQLVETRVNDFLGPNDGLNDGPSNGPSVAPGVVPMTTVASVMPAILPRPMPPRPVLPPLAPARPVEARQVPAPAPAPVHGAPAVAPSPMTSAAVRFAVDPPPPIIKPRQDTAAPKPAEKRPEQIFTF